MACIRDWCNVEDTCKAIDTVLQKGDEGSVYNAGAGNEKTNLELAEKLVELCDAENSLINKVADRSGHDRRYSVNSDLINELGWTPQCDFEKGLENTVEWYRANRKWWEPLRNSQQMTVLICGSTGRLGRSVTSFRKQTTVVAPTRNEIDFTSKEALAI